MPQTCCRQATVMPRRLARSGGAGWSCGAPIAWRRRIVMTAPEWNEATMRAVAARLVPGPGSLRLRRMTTGGSTPVYRLQRGDIVRYLRLAERPEASLAPEALAHDVLRTRGARVPEVVAFEPFDPE